MIDVTPTILAKSDQLNACDLVGGGRTVTITDIKLSTTDQPLTINYEGDDGKPYKPCKGMRRVMVKGWGSDGKKFIGRSMTLFCEDDVTWAGQKVGGIRISHMSDIDKSFTMMLVMNRKSKKAYTVQPLVTARDKKVIIDEGVKSLDIKKWGAGLNDADKAVATANWKKIKELRGE